MDCQKEKEVCNNMLEIQGRKYASVTVCDVTLYDLVTDYPVMYFDTLKLTSLEGTAESTRWTWKS